MADDYTQMTPEALRTQWQQIVTGFEQAAANATPPVTQPVKGTVGPTPANEKTFEVGRGMRGTTVTYLDRPGTPSIYYPSYKAMPSATMGSPGELAPPLREAVPAATAGGPMLTKTAIRPLLIGGETPRPTQTKLRELSQIEPPRSPSVTSQAWQTLGEAANTVGGWTGGGWGRQPERKPLQPGQQEW